jgi:hypothetical protein
VAQAFSTNLITAPDRTPGAAAALGGHQAKLDRTCRHSRRRAGNLLELVNAIEAARVGCRLPVGTR